MSEVGLLYSNASITPRSIAGTISPPGNWVTLQPNSCIRSAAKPTVRYLRPFNCAALLIGFLNHPNGWVGIGIAKNPTTLRPIFCISSLSNGISSLCIQARLWAASQPVTGPEPNSEATLLLPYQ